MNTMHENRKAWRVCFTASVILFCNAGLTSAGFSAYQPYLIKLGGLTNAESSSIILFRTLFSLAGIFSVNRLMEKIGLKKLLVFATALCSASFFLYAKAASPPAYYFAAAFNGLVIGIGGVIPISALIHRFFTESEGLAIGIATAASGLSTIVAAPVVTALVTRKSLGASFASEGVFVLAAALLALLTLKEYPPDYTVKEKKESRPTVSTELKNNRYYSFMCFGILLFGCATNNFYAFLSVLYQSYGFEDMNVSLIISVFGFTVMTGKMIYGMLSDKYGVYAASWLLYICAFLGTVMSCIPMNNSLGFAAAGAVLSGFGYAIGMACVPLYASRIAKDHSYSAVTRNFQMMSMLGALAFSRIPGMVADKTDSYVPSFIIMGMLVLVSSIIIQFSFKKLQEEVEEFGLPVEP